MTRPPDAGSPCLVVASSGRLLAEALAAAGRAVDVCDAFGDLDCRAVARCCRVLPWSAADDPAPQAGALLAAVREWVGLHPDGILVAGAGFEHRPVLLAECARLLPLAGTAPVDLERCKDPWQLLAACQRLGLDSPDLREPGTVAPDGWLSRRIGGCGGAHIETAAGSASTQRVWQRELPGMPVSLLFHAAPDLLTPLCWARQYCAPTPGARFRFGGVVALDPRDAAWSAELLRAARGLATAFGLRGLNGLDGLWDGSRLWVLELNPRPTASLALLSDAARAHWMRAHLASAAPREACANAAAQKTELQPEGVAGPDRAPAGHALNAGAAVVYASARLSIPADFRFPPGCHDLPALPQDFEAGAPVCSVQVCTGGIEKLRTLIGLLRERLLPVAGADLLSSL